MIQFYLPFVTAIALSFIAGFYSVIGLAQIFPGSFWPIVVMGSVLEISKLVTISWVYNNWNRTNRLMKTYFITATILLMLITSMGIFGYLSRAHIESNIVVGSNSLQLKTIETQEKIARDRLEYLLKQAQIPEKANSRLDRDIRATQAELKTLSQEKLPLLSEENKLTAEIGPIKYVADLFFNKNDPSFIDKAVRLVIIIIIFVFDPLAILLLIAAQQSYEKLKYKEKRSMSSKKVIDKPTGNNVKYNNVNNEVIPKEKIAKINNGDF